MRLRPTWDVFFLEVAEAWAARSKDPTTRVGAIVVNADRVQVAQGYNGFPRGVVDDPVRWELRDEKLAWTVHAEANAIANAARVGAPTAGATLYVTPVFPCLDCAKLLVQAGIRRVVTDGRVWAAPGHDHRKAEAVLREGGVALDWFVTSSKMEDA